jgi:cytoskeletal protein CcmA (bactofilin family)
VARRSPVPEKALRDCEPQADEKGSRHPRPWPSIIGSTVVMKGDLIVGEDLVIEGTFDGTITGKGPDTVTVRRTARLRGEVSASNVRVEGGTNLENTVLSGRIGRTNQ